MSVELSWFKSSYSDDQGGECLEVAYTWRKSTHRSDVEDARVEVGTCPQATHVRDSKLGARSPRLAVPAHAWAAFVTYAGHIGG